MANPVVKLFLDQAKNQPDVDAIVWHGESISYRRLAVAISQLTRVLRNHDVRPGSYVPVLSSRCVEAIIAFLSILQIGACYIPMDLESWSRQRIQDTVKKLSPRAIVHTGGEQLGDWPAVSRERIRQCMIEDAPSVTDCISPSDGNNSAYVIFTSGTTGEPKGVIISNKSLFHYVQQNHEDAPFNLGVVSGDRVLLMLSVAFDAFTCITFCTLCNGGTLLLSDISTFIEDSQSCTILPTTPSLLKLLPDPANYDFIRYIFLGGESTPPRLLHKWLNGRRRLFNGYGATETTCTSLMSELRAGVPITLGRQISGSNVYLLDSMLEESREGEIAITGPGLAEGYYMNQPATDAKFRQWKGERIYLTGDFAKSTAEGLVFLGRKDSMVKNRNFLINIEAQVIPMLRGHPDVDDAVAFMYHDTLATFLTPAHLDVNNLLKDLRNSVDQFLVPDLARSISNLPLTANGKVDVLLLKRSLDEDMYAVAPSQNEGRLDILIRALSQCLLIPTANIDPHESFWSLGGNSLSAIKVLSRLYECGLNLTLKAIYDATQLDQLAEKMTPLHSQSPPSERTTDGAPVTYSSRNIQHPILPTIQQVQMAFSTMKYYKTSNILTTMRMERSEISPSTLERAWRVMVSRHSIFKYEFDLRGEPTVCIRNRELDWKHIVELEDPEAMVRKSSQEMLSTTAIDERGVFRPKNILRLIESPGTDSILLWLVHHSIVDGWSIGILFEELEAILKGNSLPAPVPYDTYLIERQQLLDRTRKESIDFWQRTLDVKATSPKLRLSRSVSLHLPDGYSAERQVSLKMTRLDLDERCRARNITSASFIYAVWAILVAEYTTAESALFGAVLSGRTFPMAGIDRVVGPVINTCPIPIDVHFSGMLLPFLRKVHDQLLDISEHQWAVADFVNDSATGARGPLYNNIVAIEFDLPGPIHDGEMHGSRVKLSRIDYPEFELVAYFDQDEDGLLLRLVYDRRIFDDFSIERMLRHAMNIFHAAIGDEAYDLGHIRGAMIGADERNSLLAATSLPLNDPSQSYVQGTIKVALDAAAEKWPYASAVDFPGGSWSYNTLSAVSNGVAASIQQLASARDRVAVLSDGSIEWLVVVLATVKSGAVYTPIDIKLPKQRIEYMFRRSGSTICILPNARCAQAFSGMSFPSFRIPDDIEKASLTRIDTHIEESDGLYMIFTSGTTGEPKPVQITHGAVMSYLSNPRARLNAAPGRRHAQMFSVGFDVSIAEIFGTLCYGATLVLKGDDPIAHLSRVHATMATPSLLATLQPENYSNLDTILLAGEKIPQSLADRWASQTRLYNGYGPCECTIICLLGEIPPLHRVTLGRPLSGTRVYILNSQSLPVPIGVTGEICISGIQVAEGYFDQKQLGNIRFMPDPFVPGARLYRTGDLGSWNEQMEVVFLGREDNQVKLRGFRVELEEVENAIMSSTPDASVAAAVAYDNNIIGVVSPASTTIDHIWEALKMQLPYYAMPTQIFSVERLPLSPNQKLDRAMVQELAEKYMTTNQFNHRKLPTTTMQKTLNKLWLEILNLPQDTKIPIDTDFIDIGGHSLRQLQLARRVSEAVDQRVPLKLIVGHSRLKDLAKALETYVIDSPQDDNRHSLFQDAQKAPIGWDGLSRLEEDIFRQHCQTNFRSALNLAVKFQLIGKLNENKIHACVTHVLRKYPLFRTLYYLDGSSARRKVVTDELSIDQLSPSCVTLNKVEEAMGRPFSLEDELPVKSFLVREQSSAWLFLKFHHIVVDKRSLQILLQEISDTFSNTENNPLEPDPAPAFTYEDWAVWDRSRAPTQHDMDTKYWYTTLRDLPQSLLTNGIEAYVPRQGDHVEFNIIRRGSSSTSFEMYLSAVALAIADVYASNDVILGISHMDRSEPGTYDIVGCFLDRLPIRINLSEQSRLTPSRITGQVRQTVNDALSHAIPYDHIARIASNANIFDVMVTYHREQDSLRNSLQLPGIDVLEYPVRMPGAKFPLLIEISETQMGLTCYFEYCIDLICAEQLSKLINLFLEKMKWLQG